MTRMRVLCARKWVSVLGCTVLLGFVAPVHADPKPLSKEEQAKVDKAIEKAVAYLKRTQTKEGNWPTHWKNRYLVGECALPAYALLEAGVPANDPVIQKAARFIRPKFADKDDTYQLSLAVLFFDRLGDPKDKKLIQSCALRLIAGQYWTGGWSYTCPRIKAGQEDDLLQALEALSHQKKGKQSAKKISKVLAKPADVLMWPMMLPWQYDTLEEYEASKGYYGPRHGTKQNQLPPGLKGFKGLAVFRELVKFGWRKQGVNPPLVGFTDNSNTQFAMLGLWAAQRHGIPVEPTFRLMVERFERTQRTNGWWPYGIPTDNNGNITFDSPDHPLPSMICVGLMGLAIGRGLKPASLKSAPPEKEDIRVLNGLAALYRAIGLPTGQMDNPIRLQSVYFLWSVERVAMLYNLPTLGDKEWYRWGAEMLVANQKAGGDWGGSPKQAVGGPSDYGSPLNTAFALLFLKHSHPMKDLSPKLPFTAKKLNEGIIRLRPSDSHQEGSTATPSRNTKPER